MTTTEQAIEARKKSITITINGAHFTVYPTKEANVMKAWSRTKQNGSYAPDTFLRLNEKYQLWIGDRYSKDDMCKGAGMKVWDVAVPQPWLDRPENKKKWMSGEWAVWSYDGKGNRTFGNPVWKTEIFRNLKKNLLATLR